MNFPVNERKLREDLHEAIDKESMINVIILLMLIRVVQVITWLRPGEREIKRLKASNATVHLEDGTEFPGLDAMLNGTEAAPEPTAEPTIGTMERALQERDRHEGLDTTLNTNQHGARCTVDAWARNDAGFVSILRVYQNGSADIAHISLFVAETDGAMLTAPQVTDRELHRLASLRPAYTPANRDHRHYRLGSTGAIPGLMQDYTRDHFGRPVTGQQVVDLAHALDVEGPIDLSEHVGMSLQFSDGLRIRIEEDNLGYCQAMAEQERTAVMIENAIANYRWDIASDHPNVPFIPMLLAWAKTPGNEVATLTIGTDGVLLSDILEKTPKEAALESPEITMTHLRILYENEGHLHSHLHPANVSGYCTPSRGRPWTGGNGQRDVYRMRFRVGESSDGVAVRDGFPSCANAV